MNTRNLAAQFEAFVKAFLAGCQELIRSARTIFTPILFPAQPMVLL